MMIDSLPGLLMESSLLLPLALIYWLFFMTSDTANLANNNWQLNSLLLSAGLITTVPLLCFTAAAKRLTLASLGFFQYIGPSLMFVLAVFLYGEPLALEKVITFGFIWAALFIYSMDSLKASKSKKSSN
jgi:chloramphenicol-sensitive protein RarD